MNHPFNFVKPTVNTPDYWLTNLDKVYDYLNSVEKGNLINIGDSSLGHSIPVLEYNPEGSTPLLVMAGVHGHEPNTVASAMNLINILEKGTDLAGKEHPDINKILDKLHLYILPVFNPDGRASCLDDFHGFGIDTLRIYACGMQKNGELIPYDADSLEPLYYFNPDDAIFMGGQFNGAGYAINRRTSLDDFKAIEVQYLLEHIKKHPVDGVIDLHGCQYNFAFQARSHQPVYWPIPREWQRRTETRFQAKDKVLLPLHGDGNPPPAPDFYYNAAVMHHHGKMMWLAIENQQGLLGDPEWVPQPSHYDIIDNTLMCVTSFLEMGVEGYFAKANQEAYGD